MLITCDIGKMSSIMHFYFLNVFLLIQSHGEVVEEICDIIKLNEVITKDKCSPLVIRTKVQLCFDIGMIFPACSSCHL